MSCPATIGAEYKLHVDGGDQLANRKLASA